MKITTKGRYGLAAMLDIALNSRQGPVSIADIAQRQAISMTYLEQLLAKLRRQALIRSIRGPGGGYVLNKDLAEITLAAIFSAIGEQVTEPCVDATQVDDHSCLCRSVFSELHAKIDCYLQAVSLADLVTQPDILAVADKQMAKLSDLNDHA